MANPPKKRVDTDELLRQWESNKKSRIFLKLAEEYRRQDFIDSAVSVLQDGLKHHANFMPAKVSLARCHMVKRKYAEAQGELEQVVAKAPDNLLAGKLLAEVLGERGELSKALAALKKLEPFAPDDPEVGERIADLEAKLKTPELGSGSGDTTEFGTGDTTEFGIDATPGMGDVDELDIGGGLDATPDKLPEALGSPPELEEIEKPAALTAEPIGLGDMPARSAATANPPAPPEVQEQEASAAPEPEMPAELANETLPEQRAADPAADLFGGAVDAAVASGAADPFGLPEDGGTAADPFGAADPLLDLGDPPGDLLGGVEEPQPAASGTETELPSAAPATEASVDDAAAVAEQEDQTSIALAELYEGQGAHDEAATLYEKLVARRPGDSAMREALDRCRKQTRPEMPAAAPASTEKPPAPAAVSAKPSWEAPKAIPQPVSAPETRPGEAAAPQLEAMLAEYQRWLDAVRSLK